MLSKLRPCEFQKAHHYDEANIERIRADLEDGSKNILNPIHVIATEDGSGMWEIIGGHDRTEASKRAGKDSIPARDFSADIKTREEKYAHWRLDNNQRKHRDKRQEAEESLLEWAGAWSDRRVAHICGCSPSFVGGVRAELVAKRQLSAVDSREGLDKKKRKASSSGLRKDKPSTPEQPQSISAFLGKPQSTVVPAAPSGAKTAQPPERVEKAPEPASDEGSTEAKALAAEDVPSETRSDVSASVRPSESVDDLDSVQSVQGSLDSAVREVGAVSEPPSIIARGLALLILDGAPDGSLPDPNDPLTVAGLEYRHRSQFLALSSWAIRVAAKCPQESPASASAAA